VASILRPMARASSALVGFFSTSLPCQMATGVSDGVAPNAWSKASALGSSPSSIQPWTSRFRVAYSRRRVALLEWREVLAALRRMVFGPLIAYRRGHRAAGVRRLEQVALDLVTALAATVGEHTAGGCPAALRARSTSTVGCAATPPGWCAAPARRSQPATVAERARP
jgi:hypothetical protein